MYLLEKATDNFFSGSWRADEEAIRVGHGKNKKRGIGSWESGEGKSRPRLGENKAWGQREDEAKAGKHQVSYLPKN